MGKNKREVRKQRLEQLAQDQTRTQNYKPRVRKGIPADLKDSYYKYSTGRLGA